MPIQSLGIFDRVFDWVVDKIFSPIIGWLSKILNSIFEWILNTIVIPLLKPVFDFLWNIVIANIADLFYTFIYTGYCKMLWLLDQLQSGFDVLIGLKDVTYTSAETGVKTQSTLLQYFMNNEIIRNAVISITFIALALSVIFAIYAVMRSTLDFDFEGKRPVGRVLNSVAKMMIAFLLVPVIAVFGVSLASIVLKQTCTAISGGDASLGKWVLAISSIDAGRGNPPTPFTNPNTGLVNEPWASLVGGETDYITFGLKIHVSQIDYLLGYASIIFMSIVMIMCLFTFIKRIFDVMIMYITSPYFVSTIVLDDGEKFKRWRENFIARVLVGFGSVIGMRIFLMMVPVIMNDQLKIFDSVAGNITGGYVIRLVFILGGMFAVYKSSTLLTGIISANVAAEENMNNAMVGGLLMAGAKKGGSFLWGKGKAAFGGLSKGSKAGGTGGAGGAKGGTGGAGGSSNKFSGGTGMSAGKFNSAKLDNVLGLKDGQIKDDYIAKNDKENELQPLSQIKGLENLDIDDDYLSNDKSAGNADTTGIKTVNDSKGIDKFEMASDAIKKDGEFVDSGLVNNPVFDLSDNLIDNDYSSDSDDEKSPHYDGDLSDSILSDYSVPDTEGTAKFIDDNASDISSLINSDYSNPETDETAKFIDNSVSDIGSLINSDYSVPDTEGTAKFIDNSVSDISSLISDENYRPTAEAEDKRDSDEIAERYAARAKRMAARNSGSAQYSAGSSSGSSGSAHYSGGTGSVNSTFTSAANDPLINPESTIASSVSSASGSSRPTDTAFSSAANDPLKNPSQNSARPVDTKFTPASDDPLLRPRNNHKNDSGKF